MDNNNIPRVKESFYQVIFGTETPLGRNFDIALIVLIISSVLVILLDSIQALNASYGSLFFRIEWLFTVFFTLEYGVRIWCSANRKAYIFSIYGVIDLCAILPTYIAIFIPAASPLLIIRLFRILRIFRVLRLLEFMSEANVLMGALRASYRKLVVFFSLMIILTTVFGCLIYVIEGPENGFDDIPKSIYWAIVTMTTVGYGDIVPMTGLGRAISALGMLLGFAIIAVPTGIITAELANKVGRERNKKNCKNCARAGHDADAGYCKYCGADM
jgi:voltage-gated potassium channel